MGALIHLRLGTFASADTLWEEDGEALVDQSALTGEEAPVEHIAGDLIYSGAIIRCSEASGVIKTIGTHSYFGQTAELVRGAGSYRHLGDLVKGLQDILPGGLIPMVDSVAVATSAAVMDLAGQYVLVTRMAAIEEVSSMDTRYTDKAGR